MTTFTKRSIFGGLLFLLIVAMGSFLTGHLSGYEAKELIKVSVSGLNTLCNTIVLASATILALLLTILGLSNKTSSELREGHYINIMMIARVDTIVFVGSLLSFVLFNLPVAESENIPPHWYEAIYYITLALSGILSAALIVVVLMLYGTVINIIKFVGLGQKEHLMAEEKIEDAED